MGQIVDEKGARQVLRAVKTKEETIKSAPSMFDISSPNSIVNRVTGSIAVAARHGPQTVLTAAEETAIEDLLVNDSRHCLGITWQQLSKNVRKLCNNGCSVP